MKKISKHSHRPKTCSAIIFPKGTDPETQLNPSADSYVWKLVPTGNFGSREYLYVRVIYWSYLKFDLSILPPNSTIISAIFNYYCIETSGSPVVYWYKVSDDSWTEGGINWNNKPPLGDLIGTHSDVVGWNSFDITGYTQEELAGNKLLSIGGKKAVDFHNKYSSKEGAYGPYLLVNFTAPYLGYSDQGCRITPILTSNEDQDVQVPPSFTNHKDQECKIVVIYLGKDQSVKVLPEFTVYADQDIQIYALQLKKDENVRVVVCFNTDQDLSLVPEFVFHLEQLVRILPGIVSNQDQHVQITRAEYLDHDVEVLPRLIIFKDQNATLLVKNYQDQTVSITPLYENVEQPISLTLELTTREDQEIEILPRLFGYPELTGLITPRWTILLDQDVQILPKLSFEDQTIRILPTPHKHQDISVTTLYAFGHLELMVKPRFDPPDYAKPEDQLISVKPAIESVDQDVTISTTIPLRDKNVRLAVEYAFIHHGVEVFASQLKMDQDLRINVGLDYVDQIVNARVIQPHLDRVIEVTAFILGQDQTVKVLPLWVHKDQGDASVRVLPRFTAHRDARVKVKVQYLNRDMIVGLLVGPSVGRVGKQSSKIMSRFISR